MSEHRPALWGGKREVQAKAQANEEPEEAPAETTYEPAVYEGDAGEPDATDAARALAEQHGIDLSSVDGTGVGGRITHDDVKALLPDE